MHLQLKDLFRFIGILFVFMIGVGVLYHANMYPAHRDMWSSVNWKYWRIWKIIYIPYFQIYGETFLETFEGKLSLRMLYISKLGRHNKENCKQNKDSILF